MTIFLTGPFVKVGAADAAKLRAFARRTCDARFDYPPADYLFSCPGCHMSGGESDGWGFLSLEYFQARPKDVAAGLLRALQGERPEAEPSARLDHCEVRSKVLPRP